MSHFALVWQRDGRPVNLRMRLPSAAALLPSTPERNTIWCSRSLVAMHAISATTTPCTPWMRHEAADCRVLFFNGRLDYRDELRQQLRIESKSTPELVLAAYDKWGNGAFAKLYGSFAIVLFDKRQQTLLCVRDAMGMHSLYYYIDRHQVMIATEPALLQKNLRIARDLDHQAITQFLMGRGLDSAETPFQRISQLPAAHTLTINREQAHLQRYWNLRIEDRSRLLSPSDYAEQLRIHLTRSVQQCVADTPTVGVKMSGGLDSTAVAATAASTGCNLVSFSYVFEQFPQSNEQPFIEATNRFCKLSHRFVYCDALYPWYQLEQWPLDPNHPFSDPYERMSQAIYRAAREQGIQVMLNGYYGDNLYSRAVDWIWELLREGRMREVSAEIRQQLGSHQGWRHPFLRAALRQLWQHRFGRFSGSPSAVALSAQMLGHAQIGLSKSTIAARVGIELRYPYRDRKLIEFMATVPAYALYSDLWQKVMMRQATCGLLPDSVRWRQQATTLMPLFVHGARREIDHIHYLLTKRTALWPHLLGSRTIPTDKQLLFGRLQTAPDHEKSLIWRCAMLELWRERFNYT